MSSFPIVERELRVASRKRSTFWVRIVAALVALVIGIGFLILTLLGPYAFIGSAALGKGLFATLTWLSLAVALSAGLFFTSDCLSEEKREGTLGFLFLTDLRSYDVVLGKLMATSVRGVYAMLAVFPILAVTLLMGGVTGAQFWKVSLALVNALFFSLVAGLFVSSISRESQKALAGSLLLLLLLVGGGPAADAILDWIKPGLFGIPVFCLSSPGFLFVIAGSKGPGPFWSCLLVNQVVAWTLLGLTCLLLPRTWQEKASRTLAVSGSWAHWWKFGGARSRTRLRGELMDLNPALWLVCRERWQAFSFWAVTILMVGGFAVAFSREESSMLWMVWSYLSALVTLALYLGIASQAARFFVEARRNGLLELLLATPLDAAQIVRGQWRGLLRMFGLPLILCLAAQLLGTILVQQKTWNQMATATAAATAATRTPPAGTGTNNMIIVTNSISVGTTLTGISSFTAPGYWVALFISGVSVLTLAANLAAVSWFGMWMGLTSRSTNLATLLTILFVQIIPWFVISFASALVIPLFLVPRLMSGNMVNPMQMVVWFPLISSALSTLLSLTKDSVFLVWARRKLHSEFRERAAQAVSPVRVPVAPPALPLAPPPLAASA